MWSVPRKEFAWQSSQQEQLPGNHKSRGEADALQAVELIVTRCVSGGIVVEQRGNFDPSLTCLVVETR